MFFRKKYHEKWDKKLNELIDNEDIELLDNYRCCFKQSGITVWIENYPYAFACPYDPIIKIYPSKKTKDRLYNIIKDKKSALEHAETQQRLKHLFGE